MRGQQVDFICDGIMMGCKKDYLQEFQTEEPQDPTPIEGTAFSQRCPLTAKTRKLLSSYIGLVNGTLLRIPPSLSEPDYNSLLKQLKKECTPVYSWVKKMGHHCDRSCRKLLAPFCSTSSLCGSFQVYKHSDTLKAILQVTSGELDIRDSTAGSKYSLIKRHAPILADAIIENMTSDGHLAEEAAEIIEFILTNIMNLFEDCEIPSSDRYAPPEDNPYHCFPAFPPKLGRANYKMNKVFRKDNHFCRKICNSHPILSPGIFTIFYRHCLGFSLMTSTESPKTPFHLFLTQFTDHHHNIRIIYDNC